jgi:hypothetical protein
MLERQYNLVIAAAITLLFVLFAPNFFAPIGIHFFAPFLIMALYFFRLSTILWLAFAAGLFLDALFVSPRFGFFAATYMVSLLIIYPLRLYFFRDWLMTVPVLTLLFSLVALLAEHIFAFLFDIPHMGGSFGAFVLSLLVVPLVDSIWALFFFALPLSMLYYYMRPKTHGKE